MKIVDNVMAVIIAIAFAASIIIAFYVSLRPSWL